jgi:PAS domain S-box-containing protein
MELGIFGIDDLKNEPEVGVREPRIRYIAELLVLTAAYVAAGALGLQMPTRHENITLLWAPSGIALAALLGLGYRVWPGVAAGAFLVNLFTHVSVLAAVGIAAGNTLGGLAGAYLLRRVARFSLSLDRVREVIAFLGLGVLVGPVISATVGLTALWLDGGPALQQRGGREFALLWSYWWLGDAMGTLLVTPLLLVWWSQPRPAWRRLQLAELATLVLTLLLVNEVTFDRRGDSGALGPLYALIPLPLLIWSAIRFGPRGAAVATFLTVMIAVAATLRGFGPFHLGSNEEQLASLHAFIALAAVISMFVAAIFSERQRNAELLQQSEERFRALVEKSSEPVFLLTADGTFLYASPNVRRVFGYEVEEFVGRQRWDLVHPEDRARTAEALKRCVDNPGKDILADFRYKASDSTWRYLEVMAINRLDDPGVGAIVAHHRDVTERHDAEEALRKSQASLAALIDNSTDPIWSVDQQMRLLCFNSSAAQKTREIYGIELTVGMSLADILPPDQAAFWVRAYTRVFQGERFTAIYESIRNGAPLFTELSLNPIVSDGAISGVAVFARDITERRRVLETLQTQAKVLENMVEGVNVADEKGYIQFTNPAFDTMFGYERGELVGRHESVLNAGSAADSNRLVQQIIEQLKERGFWAGEFENRKKDGTLFISFARISVLNMPGKKYWIGVQEDITERKRAEAELKRAKEAAEAASQAKSEFLAKVSHEIRTPLNGILGMTELALDTPLTSDQREYLSLVKSSADSLLAVINDVLDFSKIEAGKLDLYPMPFVLHECLVDTVKPLAVRAAKKGLQLNYHVAADVPDLLLGDPYRLRQVLVNLIGNAIKFTEQGRIGVSVKIADSQSQDAASAPVDPQRATCNLQFSVTDTGIGIAPDRQEAVFEAFTQADNSTTRRFGGTGLGLAIAARLVSLMSGRIWVDSAVGSGSTFHFTAQFYTLPEGAPLPTVGRAFSPLPSSRPLHVLLAEDNPINQRLMTKMLEKMGHQVTLVENGKAVVERVARDPFDLVLMDVQMPELDGLEATRQIRRREAAGGGHLPIVALTAHAMKGDRERCLESGMDGYLAKPVRWSELRAVIGQVLVGAKSEPALAPESR